MNETNWARTRWRLLGAAGLSGAAVMIFELTAVRALAPAVGASLYVWTNVIGVVLVALAAGYWYGGALADRAPDPSILGRRVLLAAALSVPAPFLAVPLCLWLLPTPESLNPGAAAAHVTRTSLSASLVLFAPPLALLGAVGPFVTRCLSDLGWEGGKAAGRTLSVSTVGSLVGTYLPAHFLIEEMGVRATFLLGSGLLLLAGMLLLKGGGRLVLSVAAVLLVAGFVPGPARRPRLQPTDASSWQEREVISERDTPYQYVRVARWSAGPGSDQLRLSLDEGVTEFHSVRPLGGGLTGFYYDYLAWLPALLSPSPGKPDVLVLGGGAGTLPALLREFYGEAIGRIVSVEIDPAVAALRSQFGWDSTPDDLCVCGDARVFVRQNPETFDLIVLDAYAKQVAIPAHLGTEEFFQLVASRLSPRGVFGINVSVPDLEGPLVQSLLRTLQQVFPSTAVVSVPGSWNVVMLASPQPDADFRGEGGPAELTSVRDHWRRGLLPGETVLVRGTVLTDDRAPLERLAREF